jgi:hypothetical protein
MADIAMHFEALVTETKTIFKYSWLIPKSTMPCIIPIDKKCGRDIIYSRLLDEYLNVDDYDIIQDSVSTLGIFKLPPYMYTMSDCHNIGLKQFDNAYLLIELFDADFKWKNTR